jgi:multisubunit Na+/H+ antiporter MnhB subunit
LATTAGRPAGADTRARHVVNIHAGALDRAGSQLCTTHESSPYRSEFPMAQSHQDNHDELHPRERPGRVGESNWRLAQLIACMIGAASIVWGMYALIRGGLNTNDLSRPRESVLGVEHTPLLALGEVGFGTLMIFAGMGRTLGRITTGVLCAALIAFGAALTSAAPMSRLHHWFGVQGPDGWTFVAVGTIGLLAALAFPPRTRHPLTGTLPPMPEQTIDDTVPSAAPAATELRHALEAEHASLS